MYGSVPTTNWKKPLAAPTGGMIAGVDRALELRRVEVGEHREPTLVDDDVAPLSSAATPRKEASAAATSARSAARGRRRGGLPTPWSSRAQPARP